MSNRDLPNDKKARMADMLADRHEKAKRILEDCCGNTSVNNIEDVARKFAMDYKNLVATYRHYKKKWERVEKTLMDFNINKLYQLREEILKEKEGK